MSERHSFGGFNFEITGHELVVRDQSGTVIDTVDLEQVEGEFQLPNGQQVDLASLLVNKAVAPEDFETAAGTPGEGKAASDGGPISFRAFAGETDDQDDGDAAGTLDQTSLSYATIDGTPDRDDAAFFGDAKFLAETEIPIAWSGHEQWSIPENQQGGDFGPLVEGDPRDYSFKLSDDRFEVVDGVLQLKDGFSFDFESESFIDIDVTVTSNTGETKTQSVHIEVIDENEGQTGIDLDNATVAENAAGAVIGKLTVSDPDAGDSQSFVLSDPRFEVVGGQLKLKDGVALDFETDPAVNVTVTATDKGGNSISQQFTIVVGDQNEAQTGLTIDNAGIDENAAGAVVGALTVSDPDSGDSQAFTVSDNRFEVVNGQLKLKDGVSMDFETESSIDVTVTATDKGGHSLSQQFTIVVGDLNEAQTALSLHGAYVAENAAGAVIGALNVTDPDAGDSQTFAVSDSRFEVANGQLKLKDGVSLDFETEPTVSVTVTATDKAGHQIAEQFTLGVGDVNEAQTALTWAGASVAENSKGAVAGTLWVADPDAGDVQSFSVSDNRFEVVNNQLTLKSGQSLNFETEPSVDVTVTATDKGGHQIAQTFTVNVANVNEAQTALTLGTSQVAENAAGAVIGTLSVTDPDAGDSQSFQVSDSRFEVVNSQLKLKSGQSLNFEVEPTVNVTVTATDQGGNQISKVFAIGVTDVNEASTAIQLSNSSVAENAAGATIGKLTTVDPDAGDTFTYQVSDSRFQVVNGQLQLKSGVSFDYETEPSVTLNVTSTDKAGHAIQQSFTVNVTNVNEAPVVTVKDGSASSQIVDINLQYNPSANATVGGYLYSNDSSGVKVPDSGLLNGVSASNMTLVAPTEVTVTFQKEAAGNRNMVGTYQYDGNGNIVAGSVKFIWLDASANTEGKLGSSMVNDFLGYGQSNTVSLGTMAAGTHVGFFTISNGASDSGNRSLLSAAASGAATQGAAMAAIAGQLSIQVDANGNGHVFVGTSQLNGGTFFSHDKSLNTDFNAGSDIDHIASGVSSKLGNQLLIGVEDLNGGGDRDYNDVVFSVNLGSYNVEKTTQSFVQPSVDFSDIDSGSLSKAVIQTSGFQAGDSLDVPASALFNVNVSHAGNDYTITITGKNGGETLDQYEAFVNAIHFATTSKAEGDRQLAYNIVDDGGLTSNIGTAKIDVANGYVVSSSEVPASQHELGSGDDHFYLNSSLKGSFDFGDGYDTLHLARADGGLSAGEKSSLDGVEAIDTTGYGFNNVALSINDVLDMTDNGQHLTILGDKGDSITLSGDGSSHHWQVASTGSDFTTYVWSDPVHQAVVEISNQLTATVST